MTQKHIIKKQILDLTLDSPVGSFTFQSEVGTLYRKEIVPLIDQYCSAIATGDGVIRIDQLEVDLGKIEKRNFGRDFKRKIAQLLPQKLTEVLQMSPNCDLFEDNTRFDHFCTETDRDFAVLEFFLYEGCLPWWVSGDESYEMPVLLQQNIASRPDKVKRLITGIVGNAALVKRLIYHVDDEILGQIIALFQPEHGSAINWLARTLLTSLVACPLLKLSEAAKLRPEVWGTMLLQSVTSEGRGFNRELAVEATVKQLAKILNADESALANQLDQAGGESVTTLPPILQTAKQLPLINGTTLKAEEYWQLLDTVGQQLKALQSALIAEALPQQITAFEKCLAEPWLMPDAVVERKTVAADRKVIRQIGKTLTAITQLKRTAKGSPKDLAKYARQLESVEKQLMKLSPKKAYQEIAVNLVRLLQTVCDAMQLLDGLLNENTILRSATPVEGLAKQNDKFEIALHNLQCDLAAVAEQNSQTAPNGLLQNISLLMETIEKLSVKAGTPEELVAFDPFSASEEIYVGNAGLVLFWPYLSQFFGTLGLVSANRFIDDLAAERAVLLLHYLVGGTAKVQEYELALNKIICGMAGAAPLNPHFEITEPEKAECESLLQAVIFNWPAIKNISVSGLRGMFLQREGLIFTRDGQRVLRVAGVAYDILVNQIPWGIGMVKLPWMEQLLLVEWG
jgi:hypothetical protein